MSKFIIAAILAFTLMPNTIVYAARFNCAAGDVACLIDSISTANALPGKHVIELEPGIYTLTAIHNTTGGENGLPSIERSIHIKPSTDSATIERNSTAPRFRFFHVAADAELILDGLTLATGNNSDGGAIYNLGLVSLLNVVLRNNAANFGALYNFGSATIQGSIFRENDAFFSGGAIYNDEGGQVLIARSTILRNFGRLGDSGILNKGSMVIRDSSIIENQTLNGIDEGGGIGNFAPGTIEIVNSTIAKNVANFGAGIYNSGQATILNSTIRDNLCTGNGATGAGIYTSTSIDASTTIENTIVAGNSLDSGVPLFSGPDCRGPLISLGNNLIGDISDCGLTLQPSNLTGDPGLAQLVESESPGESHYPVESDSPVTGAADKKACSPKDQLGNVRGVLATLARLSLLGRK